jgi:hypothetical protein
MGENIKMSLEGKRNGVWTGFFWLGTLINGGLF